MDRAPWAARSSSSPISRIPRSFTLSGEATVSGTDGGGFNYTINGMLNLPLIDNQMALRLVGTDSHTSGWIDRIVLSNFPSADPTGFIRGNVLGARSNTITRNRTLSIWREPAARLLWQVTDNFTLTPTVFYQRITQDGPSAYDSVPGTMAHYQPFDIAEPYSDEFTLGALTANYHASEFRSHFGHGAWTRASTQTQDTSESFENPYTCITVAPTAVELPFYGANGVGIRAGGGHRNRPLQPIQRGATHCFHRGRSAQRRRRRVLFGLQVPVATQHAEPE
jgi:iron complex outermembrane receptor protein